MVIEFGIDRVVAGGDGMGSHGGLKVFVPMTAPNDVVRARVVQRKRDYAVAELVSVLEPSPMRTRPACPLFGQCGGCQFQHIDYTSQLVVKKMMVNDALQHIGRVFVPVSNPVPSPEPWRYRNKTQYPVAGNGRVLVGFYRRATHRVVDVPECLLHPADFDRLRAVAAAGIARWDRPYRERSHSGNTRHFVLRQSMPDRETLAMLVTRTRKVEPRLVDELARCENVVGVVQSTNPEPTNRVLGHKARVIHGRDHLFQPVLGLSLRVSADSFFQVNVGQAEELCRKVLKQVAPTGTETVADLYCGVGMLALALARFVKKVVGVEVHYTAVEDARFNARAAGLTNVDFRCGDAEEVLAAIEEVDVLVVDPPRKGCSPGVLRRAIQLRPRRIVYVSCNPATLARDLAVLEQAGYSTTSVEPIDMFPHTHHVEVVAGLVRSAA